jgi:hypothetical protein
LHFFQLAIVYGKQQMDKHIGKKIGINTPDFTIIAANSYNTTLMGPFGAECPINKHGIFHLWNIDENIFKKNEFPRTITKAVTDLYYIPNPPADYEELQTHNVTVTITKL